MLFISKYLYTSTNIIFKNYYMLIVKCIRE